MDLGPGEPLRMQDDNCVVRRSHQYMSQGVIYRLYMFLHSQLDVIDRMSNYRLLEDGRLQL